MPTRLFLDWSRPLLPAIVDRLLPPSPEGPVHLGSVLVVAPTRQAGRRLRERLARETRVRGGTAVLSGRVVPPSAFLQPAEGTPPAHPFDVLQVWTEVLTGQDPRALPALLPGRSERLGPAAALEFGRRLQSLREELADGDLDLAAVSGRHPLESECARWRDMAALESQFRQGLANMGLVDPCDAKRERANSFTVPEGVERIVLAGVPDPSPLILQCLRRLDSLMRVECWIHAPESEAEHFDEWGRPSENWRARAVGPEPEPRGWIELLPDPGALCGRVAELLGQGPARPALAFGLLDESLSPRLRDALARVERDLYDPRPLPLSDQPPVRLLDLLHDVQRQRDGTSLRNLWRHPDLLASLGGKPEDLLAAWDRYAAKHVPTSPESVDETLRDPALLPAWQRLRGHLAADTATARLRVLEEVYAGVRRNPNQPADRFALRAASETAEILQEAARRERQGNPPSAEAVAHLLRQQRVDPPRVEGDVTAEGWLELSYHPAPTLLLIGMQEGCVPGTRVADPFLPDGLKLQLGLRSDRDWLARDAYLFHAMVRCRAPGSVRVLCVKRDAAGGPVHPSRLLFQCSDEQLLSRAKLLFAEPPPTARLPHAEPGILLDLTRPPARPVERLSVTSLRAYLACPTRFFLANVLRMEKVRDTAREPDAAAFGTLLHQVLEFCTRNAPCDPHRWPELIDGELDRLVRDWFGPSSGLAVRVMTRGARARLHAAARVQAELAAEGWEPVQTELKLERPLNGLTLSGKIDRVDRHPQKGWRIIDYKTSDSPAKPAETHLGPRKSEHEALWVEDPKGRPKQWADLQLPAYRWLAETLDVIPPGDPVEVAYFQLPKAVNETALVTWDQEPLLAESARGAMAHIADQIQRGVWGPPAENPRHDDFAELFHYHADGLRIPGVPRSSTL